MNKFRVSDVFGILGYAILFLAIVDMAIVMFSFIQIMNGGDVPHIAFWDSQMSLIARVLAH